MNTFHLLKFSVSKKKTLVIEIAANRLASVKTLKKWQDEFKVKFDYDLCDEKVNRIRCQLSLQWKHRIKICSKFSQVWV